MGCWFYFHGLVLVRVRIRDGPKKKIIIICDDAPTFQRSDRGGRLENINAPRIAATPNGNHLDRTSNNGFVNREHNV